MKGRHVKNSRSYSNPMGFHSHELGEALSDDLSFPSDSVFYFSVACVLGISFDFVVFFQ